MNRWHTSSCRSLLKAPWWLLFPSRLLILPAIKNAILLLCIRAALKFQVYNVNPATCFLYFCNLSRCRFNSSTALSVSCEFQWQRTTNSTNAHNFLVKEQNHANSVSSKVSVHDSAGRERVYVLDLRIWYSPRSFCASHPRYPWFFQFGNPPSWSWPCLGWVRLFFWLPFDVCTKTTTKGIGRGLTKHKTPFLRFGWPAYWKGYGTLQTVYPVNRPYQVCRHLLLASGDRCRCSVWSSPADCHNIDFQASSVVAGCSWWRGFWYPISRDDFHEWLCGLYADVERLGCPSPSNWEVQLVSEPHVDVLSDFQLRPDSWILLHPFGSGGSWICARQSAFSVEIVHYHHNRNQRGLQLQVTTRATTFEESRHNWF